MAHNPPVVQHPIPDDVRVFWINDYECWAGPSLEACIEASMAEFGVTREEACEDVADAREVPRADWETTKIPNDEDERIFYTGRGRERDVDWERTPWATLQEFVAEHEKFPALIGCTE